MSKQIREVILNFGWNKGLGQFNADNSLDHLSDVNNMVFSGEQIKRREGSIRLNPEERIHKFLFFKELEIAKTKLLIGITASNLNMVAYTAQFPEIEYTLYRSDYAQWLPVSFMSMFRNPEEFDPVVTVHDYHHVETTQSHFIVSSNGKTLEILKNGSIEFDHTQARIYIDVRDATNYPPVAILNVLETDNSTKPISGRVRVGEVNERGVISELSEPQQDLRQVQAYFTRSQQAVAPRKDETDNLGIAGIRSIHYYRQSATPGDTYSYSSISGVDSDNVGGENGQQIEEIDLTKVLPTLNAVQGTRTFTLYPEVDTDQSTGRTGKALPLFIVRAQLDPILGTESPATNTYGFLWTPHKDSGVFADPVGFQLKEGTYSISTHNIYKYCTKPAAAGTSIFTLYNPASPADTPFSTDLALNSTPDPFTVIKVSDTAPRLFKFNEKVKAGKFTTLIGDGGTFTATAKSITSPWLESALADCMDIKASYWTGATFKTINVRFLLVFVHVTDPVGNDPATGFPSTKPYFTSKFDFIDGFSDLTLQFIGAKNLGYNTWEAEVTTFPPPYIDAITQKVYVPAIPGGEYDILMTTASYLKECTKPFAVVADDGKVLGTSQVYYYNNDFTKLPEYTSISHKRAYFPVIAPDYQMFQPVVGDLSTKAVSVGMGINAIAYTTGKMVVSTQNQLLDTDVNFMIKSVIEGSPGTVKFLFPINKFIVGVTERQIFVIDEHNRVSIIQNIDTPVCTCPALGGQLLVTNTQALLVFPEFIEDAVVVRTQDLKNSSIPEVVFEENTKCTGTFERFYVGSGSSIYEFHQGKWTKHNALGDEYFIDAMAIHKGSLVIALTSRDFDLSTLFPSNNNIQPG